MKKYLKWGGIGLVVLVVISAIAGGSSDKKKDTAATTVTVTKTAPAASATPAATAAAPPPAAAEPPPPAADPSDAGCGIKATDDCTPHLGSSALVRVDALGWRVRSVRVTKTLGDQELGLGAKANGLFVVVKLHVHSFKNESATLTDGAVHLEVKGNIYDADSDGTIAAIGSGDKPFFLDTIGPDSDRDGIVVFDVPRKVLSQKVEVRFNELGFGTTHGYIRLPAAG